MAEWIVRTRGDYPHLLPHLVQAVVSRRWEGNQEMVWVVEMTEEEAQGLLSREFVTAVEMAHLIEQS
jgi:hypothetical protein